MLSTMCLVAFSCGNFLEEKLNTKIQSTMRVSAFSYENYQRSWTQKVSTKMLSTK